MVNNLLEERATLVRRINEIDALLARQGIAITTKIARSRPRHAAVLVTVTSGPRSVRDIAAATGQGIHAAQQMLHLMTKSGELERVGRGLYGAAKKTKRKAPATRDT